MQTPSLILHSLEPESWSQSLCWSEPLWRVSPLRVQENVTQFAPSGSPRGSCASASCFIAKGLDDQAAPMTLSPVTHSSRLFHTFSFINSIYILFLALGIPLKASFPLFSLYWWPACYINLVGSLFYLLPYMALINSMAKVSKLIPLIRLWWSCRST